jgi:hypothetical protein
MSEVDFKFCRSADNVADVFTDAVVRSSAPAWGWVLCWGVGLSGV